MAKERPGEIPQAALMARPSWKPLPAIGVLTGDADFFKREVVERFAKELSADGEPWVRRYRAAERESGKPTTAEVLDDVRTPSFLASSRLVIVEDAAEFLERSRETLEPFLSTGFSGGHLLLLLDSLDLRTRFAKALVEAGAWLIACAQPWDRPPPWKPAADPWDNDLARWVAARAASKGMGLDLETAGAFCDRVGSDLATLDEELEKLKTYLGQGKRRASLADIEAVAGAFREDSIFDLVDSFLAADRARAIEVAQGLLRSGYRPTKGPPVTGTVSISMMFIGALISRLRALRRAHALRTEGPDAWMALRLTSRPFLPRFQRDLKSTPPARIQRALGALRDIDRAAKSGGPVEHLLEAFLLTA